MSSLRANFPQQVGSEGPPIASRGRRESYARTDESVTFEYPDESQMPHSPTIEGMRYKRTLTQFSLEKKVTVVTGGARGLGLVMSQAIITSGADLAIVDLNSMFLGLLVIPAVQMLTQFSNRGRSRIPGQQLGQTIQGREPHLGAVCLPFVCIMSSMLTSNFEKPPYDYRTLCRCRQSRLGQQGPGRDHRPARPH